MTRCETCLRLTWEKGRCIMDDCGRRPEAETENLAFRLLAYKGYVLREGIVYLIENDDPENYQETMIGESPGSMADAWRNLAGHRFPKTPTIMCRSCHENPSDFGGHCADCRLEELEWAEAERAESF